MKIINALRAEFPFFSYNPTLVYLDSAATSQLHVSVLDAMHNFYTHYNSNIHRGVYALAEIATQQYEEAREALARFVVAVQKEEIVFTRGATEGINLVAQAWGRQQLKEGDEILLGPWEHHSNLIPWQVLAQEKNLILRFLPTNAQDLIDLTQLEQVITPQTRLIAITQVSHVLGNENPIREIVQIAHRQEVKVLVDGAQSLPHMPVNVQDLDCDFFVASGHKCYAPTGIGFVYIKAKIAETVGLFQTGSNMVQKVSSKKSVFKKAPDRFEAGTPNIAGAIALGQAVQMMMSKDLDAIFRYEQDLLQYTFGRLLELPFIRVLGNAIPRRGVISFLVDGVHSHDVAAYLNEFHIAIRAGNHCCQPLFQHYDLAGANRIGIGMYSLQCEIDAIIYCLQKLHAYFHPRKVTNR